MGFCKRGWREKDFGNGVASLEDKVGGGASAVPVLVLLQSHNLILWMLIDKRIILAKTGEFCGMRSSEMLSVVSGDLGCRRQRNT